MSQILMVASAYATASKLPGSGDGVALRVDLVRNDEDQLVNKPVRHSRKRCVGRAVRILVSMDEVIPVCFDSDI